MVTNTELQRVGLSGWRTGLPSLLNKENRAWWASHRWLTQSILWTVVVNGFVALMVFVLLPSGQSMSEDPAAGSTESLTTAAQMLVQLALMALATGAIVLVQDAIIAERQVGVTEWLLSKPVSRPAYLLSKLLAHGLGVLVILVGLQGALGYGQLSLVMGEPFPLRPYLVGMAGLAVHTLFYLTLTFMMGVLTTNRRTLLGVSLGSLMGGMMIVQILAVPAGKLVLLTPWSLNNALPAAVLGIPLPLSIWLTIGVTAILSAIFVAVAVTRFERLEF
jgi:ABC-2 type transport system permease protein